MTEVDDAVLTPTKFVRGVATRRGVQIRDFGVQKLVLMFFNAAPFRACVEQLRARMVPEWIYQEDRPLYRAEIEATPASIFQSTVGAPAAVMYMEELIACGAEGFLVAGMAGSLQPTITPGHFICPTAAVRGDGTSRYYLPEQEEASADPNTLHALETACERQGTRVHKGSVWTTDAPYAESLRRVRELRAQGVLGVEMETAAIFACARRRGVRAACLLAVSDLVLDEWTPAFHWAEYRTAVQRTPQILVDAASTLLRKERAS